MRIIKKNQRISKKRKVGLVVFFILFLIFTSYIGVGLFIYLDISSYNQDLGRFYWWDSEECIYTGNRAFKDFYASADWDFFEDRAYIYEDWTNDYNIAKEEWDCASTIVETSFEYGMISPFTDAVKNAQEVNDFLNNANSKYRIIAGVNPYHGYGDSPIWTGTYIASLAFHYAVACEEGDVSEINDVLNKMIRPIEGLHILTHVTGLDGNLARWAVKDTLENRARFQSFFYKRDSNGNLVEKAGNLDENCYKGQGEYSDWYYSDDTSRDQHIGLFLGYGVAYKILSNTIDPNGIDSTLKDEILTKIKDDGLDVLDRLIGAGWDVISGEPVIGEGRGNSGASFYPRPPWEGGGCYLLAYTSLGKMMDPVRYTKYYNEAINRFLTTSYHFAIAQQSGSYFGNNLAIEGLLLAYFIEDDPNVRSDIRDHFNEDFYANVQFHRNSWLNLGYLVINDLTLSDILQDAKLTYKLDDISDNLYRFATKRFPSREWHIPRVVDVDQLVHPKAKMYNEIFQEDSPHIINTLYGSIFREFANTDEMSSFALGVDELREADFIWQKSPFSVNGFYPDDENHLGNIQNPGIDYTVCYWLGRYYNYF